MTTECVLKASHLEGPSSPSSLSRIYIVRIISRCLLLLLLLLLPVGSSCQAKGRIHFPTDRLFPFFFLLANPPAIAVKTLDDLFRYEFEAFSCCCWLLLVAATLQEEKIYEMSMNSDSLVEPSRTAVKL